MVSKYRELRVSQVCNALIIAIVSPKPMYKTPQKCTEKACAGLRLDATMPAVGAVKITGNMGNIHAGVMFAAWRWCLFVKSREYMPSANKNATGA